MSARLAQPASQTEDLLLAIALLAVVVVLCLAWLWLVPFQLTPPRVAG